jgi:hypothetical protein
LNHLLIHLFDVLDEKILSTTLNSQTANHIKVDSVSYAHNVDGGYIAVFHLTNHLRELILIE